ncbi:rod shape-determining protein MreD [uncultured Clostridium sp.]|uniref:rod shape-determining protein MreD n=1 Tax=uncultured Clostridium sp. TaxID=59620 RepID=UPI0026255090|nr:rod shape-determining protein MreD [uncultured Clostridium sp.]
MIKKIILILICILLFVLDNSIMPFLGIGGVYPSLLFVFVILFSTINGYWDAIILGSVSGILQDIYFTHIFGVNALINLILCLIAAYIGDTIIKNRIIIPVVTVAGLTAVKFIIILIIGKSLMLNVPIENIFIMVIYNFVMAIVMYSWVSRISDRDLMRKSWNFGKHR